MRYKLGNSFWGVIYLYTPFISTCILAIWKNDDNFTIYFLPCLFALVSLFAFLLLKFSYIDLQNKYIIINCMGFISKRYEIEKIESMEISESYFGLMALGKQKIVFQMRDGITKKIKISLKDNQLFLDEVKKCEMSLLHE